jgi:hypothetical protein
MKAPLELHIDELVLIGLEGYDRYAVADAVQCELERLVAINGAATFRRSASHDVIDGGAFRVARPSRPQALGAQASRSIFNGLARGNRRSHGGRR